MKFMMSERIQGKLADQEIGVPPVRATLSEKWYAKTPPDHRGLIREQLLADNRKVANTFYGAAEVLAAIQPNLDNAFYNGQDVEAQLNEAATVMDQELEKAWTKFGT